jgi:uncharacterized protein YndB with AHSA1/START domain
MNPSRFEYVTYIRTSPAHLWDAITKPELTTQWWWGTHQETAWKAGSPWKLIFSDGRLADAGEILEIDRPRHLVLKWRNEFSPFLKADGYTRCRFAIEHAGTIVKLTVTHEADQPHKLIAAVSEGWPRTLSSLKSLLETGTALPGTDASPRG